LEELDLDELTETNDELYELLKRIRHDDPNGYGKEDDIPLTDVELDSIGPWFMAAFRVKDQGVIENDGNVTYGAITDGYKEYLEYMNKLYEEKLLDPETFSQDRKSVV